MTENEKAQKPKVKRERRGMTFTVPEALAGEIKAVAEKAGMAQAVVRKMVADAVFAKPPNVADLVVSKIRGDLT